MNDRGLRGDIDALLDAATDMGKALRDDDALEMVNRIEAALAQHSEPGRVPDDWQQPAWRPIDTYPKDQGVYQNGSRVWLWHEDLGVCWGFMDALPSGFRCDLYQKGDGLWVVVACGVKEAKKLHYWMPAAPSMPEPPLAAAPEPEGEDDEQTN